MPGQLSEKETCTHHVEKNHFDVNIGDGSCPGCAQQLIQKVSVQLLPVGHHINSRHDLIGDQSPHHLLVLLCQQSFALTNDPANVHVQLIFQSADLHPIPEHEAA